MSNDSNKDGIHGAPLVAGAVISFGIGWLMVSFFRWFARTAWPWIKRHPIATLLIVLMMYADGQYCDTHHLSDQADGTLSIFVLIAMGVVICIANVMED